MCGSSEATRLTRYPRLAGLVAAVLAGATQLGTQGDRRRLLLDGRQARRNSGDKIQGITARGNQ